MRWRLVATVKMHLLGMMSLLQMRVLQMRLRCRNENASPATLGPRRPLPPLLLNHRRPRDQNFPNSNRNNAHLRLHKA